MAFDWKKLRGKAKKALAEGVIKGEELAGKGLKKAAEFGEEVKTEVEALKKSKPYPAPRPAPKPPEAKD